MQLCLSAHSLWAPELRSPSHLSPFLSPVLLLEMEEALETTGGERGPEVKQGYNVTPINCLSLALLERCFVLGYQNKQRVSPPYKRELTNFGMVTCFGWVPIIFFSLFKTEIKSIAHKTHHCNPFKSVQLSDFYIYHNVPQPPLSSSRTVPSTTK